jgi:hypothetical protein
MDTETSKNPDEVELEKLQTELDAVNREKSARVEAINASTVVARKKLELEKAKRAAANLAIVEEYTKKLGVRGVEWDACEFRLGIAILKRPSRPVFTEWSPVAASTDSKDLMKLVSPSVAYPSQVEFDKYLSDEPLKLIACSAIVARLGGTSEKDLEGK